MMQGMGSVVRTGSGMVMIVSLSLALSSRCAAVFVVFGVVIG
jgi:hypothetical protein